MSLYQGSALSPTQVAALLSEARARTRWLVEPLTTVELHAQHSPLMSPIIWDLGHIGHFEEVWLVEQVETGGTGSEGLRGIYNPFEHPRSTRSGLQLPTLEECFTYQDRIRDVVLENMTSTGLPHQSELLAEGYVYRMVAQHEYQHNETILQTLQLMGGRRYPARRGRLFPHGSHRDPPDDSMVRVPGGAVTIGTDDRSAAYDNERGRHVLEIEPFWIDATPVTNGAYRAFVDSGGYENPKVWSEAGRVWLEESDATAPMHWTRTESGWTERFMDLTKPLDPTRPVCHVCYHEAEAFARWSGKRLPTEQEWEVAATWAPEKGEKLLFPWGEEDPSPLHANLDVLAFDTAPVWSLPMNVSPVGCYGMIGDVWEWTSSDFLPYPGYRTFPYPEYSEVFFGDEYKVLRGGSWATRPGAIRSTFRNWDYPIRRQIFAGFRCARDA
jgi:iron(II)-dependent oxidoreductase